MGVSRVDRLAAALGILAVALASCGLAGFGGDRLATPAGMPEAIGPIIEIGSGQVGGAAWQYSVYESDAGTCTRVEFPDSTSETCGPGLGLMPGDRQMSLSGVGTGTGMPTQIEGFATADVAEVWLETDAGRVPATLMALAPAGLDGQAFLAFVPPGQAVSAVFALDADGDEIGREPVDVP